VSGQLVPALLTHINASAARSCAAPHDGRM